MSPLKKNILNFLKIIDVAISSLVDACIELLLITMLSSALVQVLARNIFNTGFDWLELFVRHSVLWLGLLGAISATRYGRQIKIDAIVKLLPFSIRKWIQLITALITGLICIWLADASLLMIKMEQEAGTKLIGNIKQTVVLWIFPIAFLLIALNAILHSVFQILTNQEETTVK